MCLVLSVLKLWVLLSLLVCWAALIWKRGSVLIKNKILFQQARKVSHEVVKDVNHWGESSKNHRVRSQSRDHTVENALSRKSALNDRYFEDKGRSRSLDNLLESVSFSYE